MVSVLKNYLILRQPERDRLEADIQKFLANGGKKEVLAMEESDLQKTVISRREFEQLEARRKGAFR